MKASTELVKASTEKDCPVLTLDPIGPAVSSADCTAATRPEDSCEKQVNRTG